MTALTAYRTTRDIPARPSILPGVPGAMLPIPQGATVYKFTGPTYGCIGDGETAISLVPDRNPFHGVPTDALEEIAPCERCGDRPATFDGDLCPSCYDTVVAGELSCDWLDEEA